MVAAVGAVPGMRVTFNLVPALVEQVEAYAARSDLGSTPRASGWPRPTRCRRRRRVVRTRGLSRPCADDDPAVSALRRTGGTCGRGARRSRPTICATCRSGRSSSGSIPTCSRPIRARGDWWGRGAGSTSTTRRRCAPSSSRCCAGWCRPIARRPTVATVELSTSPYFHPILPLLCDSAAHHAAHPTAPVAGSAVPASRGRGAAAPAGDRRRTNAGSAGPRPGSGRRRAACRIWRRPRSARAGLPVDGQRRGDPRRGPSSPTPLDPGAAMPAACAADPSRGGPRPVPRPRPVRPGRVHLSGLERRGRGGRLPGPGARGRPARRDARGRPTRWCR